MKDGDEPSHRASNTIGEPELASYAPHFPACCRLVTCYTSGRLPVLAEESVAHLWQTLLLEVRQELCYQLYGYVTLPDHMHLLFAPPAGHAPKEIVQQAQDRFEVDYRAVMGLPDGAPVWSRHQRIDRLADMDAFAAVLDYIHYNPVHHGLVARPEEWPHSSYGAWVERKLYKLGWGWQMPPRIKDKHWE
jgi:putative transposase